MRMQKWKNVSRFLLVVTVLSVLFISCKNHKDPNKTFSKFYIIPHAERHPGFNGHLTWYGRLRAGDLMRQLQDSGIQKIYLTPFSRSFETADSLIALKKIDTSIYKVDTTAASLITQIKNNKDFGKTVLIVASRNLIPGIIQGLGGNYSRGAVPDSVSNVIFELINDHGKAQLKTSQYGRPNFVSTPPANIDTTAAAK